MIRPPSLQRTYNEHWSQDAAFYQPAADATVEQVRDYLAKLEVAWDTGDWSALRVEGGGEPTTFVVRPLGVEQLGKLRDLRSAGMGDNEISQLAFRCALVSVSNLGDVKVKHVEDERFGRIASLSFLAEAGIFGDFGVQLVVELGTRVFKRANGIPPKR